MPGMPNRTEHDNRTSRGERSRRIGGSPPRWRKQEVEEDGRGRSALGERRVGERARDTKKASPSEITDRRAELSDCLARYSGGPRHGSPARGTNERTNERTDGEPRARGRRTALLPDRLVAVAQPSSSLRRRRRRPPRRRPTATSRGFL